MASHFEFDIFSQTDYLFSSYFHFHFSVVSAELPYLISAIRNIQRLTYIVHNEINHIHKPELSVTICTNIGCKLLATNETQEERLRENERGHDGEKDTEIRREREREKGENHGVSNGKCTGRETEREWKENNKLKKAVGEKERNAIKRIEISINLKNRKFIERGGEGI